MVNLLDKRRSPLVIAGPCSAESREQLLDTCEQLARTGRVDLLRAGLWKPRTRPDSFEGVGEEGLPWLKEVSERTGLPVATEVASARHVEGVLRHGIDCIWLGARTTVNPFLVQEIADAAAGSRLMILIKNPMHPDIELWAGAVERLHKAGVAHDRMALVHRGFSTSNHWLYRNDPMWHLAFDIKRRFPTLPLICDPSHISGRRELLHEVAQRAADLNFDGLMIESHCSPQAALSDALQQITPEELVQLLASLTWRSACSFDTEYVRTLTRFRSEIDQLDSEIFELLSRRMQIADRIGRIKRENEVVILQQNRWEEIVERIVARSKELHLGENFLRTVLDAIHNESIDHQNRIMNEEPKKP